MELKDKKIVFLGDSITEGWMVKEEKNIFWNRVGQQTGAQVFGYGIGGTRIAKQRIPSEDPECDRYFASRLEEMIPDADIVAVFGGTNDFGHGDAPMGSMQDRSEDTFYGAYHMLLQKLIARYPAAQLVVMTPLHRGSEEDDGLNTKGVRRAGTLLRYVQAIREVAQYYGVPVIDLYANCSIQPKVALQKQLYMPDGLHPNDAGHKIIADRVCGALRAL